MYCDKWTEPWSTVIYCETNCSVLWYSMLRVMQHCHTTHDSECCVWTRQYTLHIVMIQSAVCGPGSTHYTLWWYRVLCGSGSTHYRLWWYRVLCVDQAVHTTHCDDTECCVWTRQYTLHIVMIQSAVCGPGSTHYTLWWYRVLCVDQAVHTTHCDDTECCVWTRLYTLHIVMQSEMHSTAKWFCSENVVLKHKILW